MTDGSRVRWIVRALLLAGFLALFYIPKLLSDRSAEAETTPPAASASAEAAAKTLDCLRKADADAEQAKAKLTTNDPSARMQAEIVIDDQRRLARIACKERAR